jgi:hypothetical protein
MRIRRIVAAPSTRPADELAPAREKLRFSSYPRRAADAISVLSPRPLRRHPGALIIAMLAATDLAYRLLLRESLRRALGVGR